MGNLIGLFFSLPTNYEHMLKKLAVYFALNTYVCILILRQVPDIGSAFLSIEKSVPFPPATASYIGWIGNVQPFSILIALLTALFAYILQFHNLISNVFRIRQRFDLYNIIMPLAILTQSRIDQAKLDRLRHSRHSLMRTIFYQYASSRSPNALVDIHDVQQALTAWSWFWILCESAAIYLIASVVAASVTAWGTACFFLAFTSAALIAALAFYPRLEARARPQIGQIASNDQAAEFIRETLNAV